MLYAKSASPSLVYSKPREAAVVVNTTIHAAAAEHLQHDAPEGRKGMGKFLAQYSMSM
jgi:hypothetical protein